MSETPAVYQAGAPVDVDADDDPAVLAPDHDMADAIECFLERVSTDRCLARVLIGTEAYSRLAKSWLTFHGAVTPEMACLLQPDQVLDLPGTTRALTSLIRWHRPGDRKPEPGKWVAIWIHTGGHSEEHVVRGVRLDGGNWSAMIGHNQVRLHDSNMIAWTELPATGVLPAPEGGAV